MSEMYDEDAVEDFLAHHGVKGMRWGVSRKANGSLNFGANPKRAHAKRMETRTKIRAKATENRQNRKAKVEANRADRVHNLISVAGGSKSKAQLINAGSGIASAFIVGAVGRTAVSALSASNPHVAAGVEIVTQLTQIGILAKTGLNSVDIQHS